MTTNYLSTFPAILPTLTEPMQSATRWVIDLVTGGGIICQNAAKIKPYGFGSDNNTFKVRIWGWTKCPGIQGSLQDFWDPTLLAELLCTLDAGVPGVAGTRVLNTMFFTDTISLTYGNANVSIDVNSPAATTLAGHVQLALKGSQKLECTFDINSSATSCNALASLS